MMNNIIPPDTYELIKKNVPIACVELLIIHEGAVLLLKRKNPPARGQWWYPGGRIFKDETIFEAAERKGKKELDVILEPQRIMSVEESIFNLQNDVVEVHTINIVVEMKIIDLNYTLHLDNDHMEYKWFRTLPSPLHTAVKNPLLAMNFRSDE